MLNYLPCYGSVLPREFGPWAAKALACRVRNVHGFPHGAKTCKRGASICNLKRKQDSRKRPTWATARSYAGGGASHYLLGHYSAARTAFLEVPKLDPLYTLLRVGLCEVHARLRNADDPGGDRASCDRWSCGLWPGRCLHLHRLGLHLLRLHLCLLLCKAASIAAARCFREMGRTRRVMHGPAFRARHHTMRTPFVQGVFVARRGLQPELPPVP